MHTPPRRPRTATLACALLLTALATARADLDVRIGNNTVADAQLGPADEVETYRITLAALSKLSVTVKAKPAKKETPPQFAIVVRDEKGEVVATGSPKGKAVKVRGFTASRSGEYRIEVTGDGVNTGAYQIKAKWKSPKRVKRDVDLDDTAGTLGFAAAPGSKATVKVKPAKKSGVLPRLQLLEAVDRSFQFAGFVPPKDSAKSHAQKNVVLGSVRDYVLTLSNLGVAGMATVDVKLRAPKAEKARVDLRDVALGGGDAPGASGGKPIEAYGGVIGPLGGALGFDAGIQGLLGGAGINCPPGALTEPTAITFGEAINALPPPSDDLEAIGPTVFFGPDGLQFLVDAEITIPIDIDALGGNPDGLQVYARDEDGVVTLIPAPYAVDVDKGTCTFPVSHFTSFCGFAPTIESDVFLENEMVFVPDDAIARDNVGGAVAIDGDVLVIGAPEADLEGSGEGAVYVYRFGQKGWEIEAKLTASDATNSAAFGTAVAVEGDTIVVGSPLARDGVILPGGVYVFQVFRGVWEESQKLIGSGVNNGDGFGSSVAIDGNTIAAGAPSESQGTGLANAGAVYIFEPIDGFLEDARLTQSNPAAQQRFGSAIALQNRRIVVGAPGSLIPGRAFVFDSDDEFQWSETAELVHGESAGEEDFGGSVALDEDVAVVGDPRFDHPGEGGGNAGRAFVFALGATWDVEKTLIPPVIENGSRFGESVAITLDFVLVGHPAFDVPPAGAGAVHVFQRNDGAWPAVLQRSADTPEILESFGIAIAASGTQIVIGGSGNTGTTGAAYLYDLTFPLPDAEPR